MTEAEEMILRLRAYSKIPRDIGIKIAMEQAADLIESLLTDKAELELRRNAKFAPFKRETDGE